MAKPNKEAANSVVGLLLHSNTELKVEHTNSDTASTCIERDASPIITPAEKTELLQSSPLRHKKQLLNNSGRIKKGIWITPEVDTLLDTEAAKMGITKSDCVEMIFRKYFNIAN